MYAVSMTHLWWGLVGLLAFGCESSSFASDTGAFNALDATNNDVFTDVLIRDVVRDTVAPSDTGVSPFSEVVSFTMYLMPRPQRPSDQYLYFGENDTDFSPQYRTFLQHARERLGHAPSAIVVTDVFVELGNGSTGVVTFDDFLESISLSMRPPFVNGFPVPNSPGQPAAVGLGSMSRLSPTSPLHWGRGPLRMAAVPSRPQNFSSIMQRYLLAGDIAAVGTSATRRDSAPTQFRSVMDVRVTFAALE